MKNDKYMNEDVYIEEVIETQGVLFDKVIDTEYSFEDFVTKYMKSDLKAKIDRRDPIRTNYLAYEQLEEFLKEATVKKSKIRNFNTLLAEWTGNFYAYLQWYLQIPSRELIEILPIEKLIKLANGLHDYDFELAVKKLLPNLKITYKGGR